MPLTELLNVLLQIQVSLTTTTTKHVLCKQSKQTSAELNSTANRTGHSLFPISTIMPAVNVYLFNMAMESLSITLTIRSRSDCLVSKQLVLPCSKISIISTIPLPMSVISSIMPNKLSTFAMLSSRQVTVIRMTQHTN